MTARSLPRYKAIETFLLERIRQGAYPVNHQIPPEQQLARDFGVSRMTANKAIDRLVQQGWLVRYPGLGTFVTDRKAESALHQVMNIAEEVRLRGHVHDNQVVRREAVRADDEIAMRLGVRLGSEVFHTILVHREDQLPIQVEDRYVQPRLVPHYLDSDFGRQTPNEVLEAACPISHVEHVVEAVPADRKAAAWLGIEVGAPCLLVMRRTWSGDQLVSYARLTHPGARYKLRSSLRVSPGNGG